MPQIIKLFANRSQAGRALAPKLERYRGEEPVVVGLARGGVPVAYEVADALNAPLDVLVVRKLSTPWDPELAIGAVTSNATVFNDDIIEELHIPTAVLMREVERERHIVDHRAALYRGDCPRIKLAERTVIIVDDGIATGASVIAAIRSVRADGARRVVVAAPICAIATFERLRVEADDVVCVEAADPFGAVGMWYHDFEQVDDGMVRSMLKRPRVGRRARSESCPTR